MNAKISMFVISVKAIIYLLLRNSHDCTLKIWKVKDTIKGIKKQTVPWRKIWKLQEGSIRIDLSSHGKEFEQSNKDDESEGVYWESFQNSFARDHRHNLWMDKRPSQI